MRYEFRAGDLITVIRVRKFLQHEIGDQAIVLRGNYGGSDPVIDVEWCGGMNDKTTVFADQFELSEARPPADPVIEDTREYLNAITGDSHA